MILVDTSVLVDYFRGRRNAAAAMFDEVLDRGFHYGINSYTYQELLQGSKSAEEFQTLKDYLESIPFYELRYGRESFEKAARLNFDCRRSGVTIRSTVDLLIAEIAIENDLYLLHNDTDFTNMHKVIPILKIFTFNSE